MEDAAARALADDLLRSTVGALELIGVYLGDRLGLYRALRDGEPHTPAELAGRAGVDARYARAWLDQQVAAGVIERELVGGPGTGSRYRLPAAHVPIVATPSGTRHRASLARMVVGTVGAIDELVDAYQTGEGVPPSRFGADFRHGRGGIDRSIYPSLLVERWLPQLPVVVDRLAAGGRAVEVGTGHGWPAIAIAQAYPSAEVIGIDADRAEIEDARINAVVAGVDVRFEQHEAGDVAALGPIDLAVLIDVLPNCGEAVEMLASLRRALRPGGCALVAGLSGSASPAFHGDRDDALVSRLLHGWAIAYCVPSTRGDRPRPAAVPIVSEGELRKLAAEAGFAHARALDAGGRPFAAYELAT